MKSIHIKRGLDLPLAGEPGQVVAPGNAVRRVALIGPDYVGMKPTMAVREGDAVKLGQLLFTDKRTSGVRYTSPAGGRVAAIHRGAKRVFLSIVIEVGEDEEQEDFKATAGPVERLSAEDVRERLVASGLWTALRTRPYSKVPPPESTPHSVFVTAIDTNPLAASPDVVLAGKIDDFRDGVRALAKLTAGKTFLCRGGNSSLPAVQVEAVEEVEFTGPHPAGLVGTHIHFLDPVGASKTVWHIGYQDVACVGRFLRTGELLMERTVSLGGPSVSSPRLLRTRLGASLEDLTAGELTTGSEGTRVVSGSVFSGRQAHGTLGFLGRYDLQVSVIPEGRRRAFLGWLNPGFDKFSVKNAVASRFSPSRKLALTTSTEGSPRAMVPIGSYERVMPLDILPTYLLRALIVGDTDSAQALGCLELDEEDLGLCTFVCPGKYEYGPILRENLTAIERDG